MYCKKCGKQIPDDSEYCNHCGTRQYPKKLDINIHAHTPQFNQDTIRYFILRICRFIKSSVFLLWPLLKRILLLIILCCVVVGFATGAYYLVNKPAAVSPQQVEYFKNKCVGDSIQAAVGRWPEHKIYYLKDNPYRYINEWKYDCFDNSWALEQYCTYGINEHRKNILISRSWVFCDKVGGIFLVLSLLYLSIYLIISFKKWLLKEGKYSDNNKD